MKLTIVLCAALLQLAASQHQCSTDNDCASSECCTVSFLPLSARKRMIFNDWLSGGHQGGKCQPLATVGHSCEPDLQGSLGSSRAHSFGCPCQQGLECHGEQESHNGGSHSYTNPKCVASGTYTDPQQGQGSGTGTGSGTIITQSPLVTVTTAPHTPDPNQPVHELPGK